MIDFIDIFLQSEGIGLALYISDWHLLGTKCRRFVLQFLTYSNLPWQLKTGFILMSINTLFAVNFVLGVDGVPTGLITFECIFLYLLDHQGILQLLYTAEPNEGLSI